MKLSDVRRIEQTHDVDRVNNLLNKGYRLIKILSSRTVDNNCEEIRPIYILGIVEEETSTK